MYGIRQPRRGHSYLVVMLSLVVTALSGACGGSVSGIANAGGAGSGSGGPFNALGGCASGIERAVNAGCPAFGSSVAAGDLEDYARLRSSDDLDLALHGRGSGGEGGAGILFRIK
jgi:hypothetical protein